MSLVHSITELAILPPVNGESHRLDRVERETKKGRRNREKAPLSVTVSSTHVAMLPYTHLPMTTWLCVGAYSTLLAVEPGFILSVL